MASHHLVGAVGRARNLRQTMTLPEKTLWAELRKLDLNIRRQAPVGRYIADFVCHAAGLVVEIDGARHDLVEDQIYDIERTSWLESQGYRVLRFRNEDVLADPVHIADLIRVAIASPKSRPDALGLVG
jgi:very-short-patch-repair endonuclease